MSGQGIDPGQMDSLEVLDQVINSTTPCTTAWEEVGLSALRSALDEQALAIAENQESSLETRRALAAQAKKFRLSVDAEVGVASEMRVASGDLVRAFKGEIDNLTTRSRFAENAFLALYKLLREAPDPVVTVQALISAARAAVEALGDRGRRLEEQRAEAFRQLEVVRSSAAARTLTTEELREERRIVREELTAEHAEAEQSRLQALQDALQEELLLAQRQTEHERAATQAQLQVLQEEMERLEARAVTFEAEAARSGQLEDLVASSDTDLKVFQEKVEYLEAEHKSLEEHASIALKARDAASQECADAQARAEAVEREMGKRVEELEQNASLLRKELESRAEASQVEVMREQIRILEGIWEDAPRLPDAESESSIATRLGNTGEPSTPMDSAQKAEMCAGERHDDQGAIGSLPSDEGRSASRTETCGQRSSSPEEETDGPADVSTDSAGRAGVDEWLISYNRRLKNEVEKLRHRTRRAEERLGRVEDERRREASELVERTQEVKRLEQDLVDAHQVVEAGKTMLRAFQSGAVAKQFGKLVGRGKLETAQDGMSLESEFVEGDEEGGYAGGAPDAEGFSAADRLLGAVKRQRDRFRKEALRREREASISKGNAEQLARNNQDLIKENMHLYKRMRYVMVYGSKGGEDVSEAEHATERKYEDLYEAGLDPFKEFDSQEKAARRGRMGAVERGLLRAVGIVTRSRFRRQLLVIYLVFVHALLIFLTTLGGGRGGVASASDVQAVLNEETLRAQLDDEQLSKPLADATAGSRPGIRSPAIVGRSQR